MEEQYLKLMEDVIENGIDTENRTGTDTRAIFGAQLKFNLNFGFPAITTKKLAWRAVVAELLWFLEGSTDERRLCEILHGTRDPRKTTIWTANADNQGAALGYENNNSVKRLGPIYGHQWRDFNGVDQINWVINEIKSNPSSRRLIVSAWNPVDIPEMALPPCHTLFQFNVQNGMLNCQLYQRSCDLPLGFSFNLASYSLLTHIIAQICNLRPGIFVHTIGDAHIYHNQFEAVQTQLERSPRHLPELILPEFESLDEAINCDISQFRLDNYDPHPKIDIPFTV